MGPAAGGALRRVRRHRRRLRLPDRDRPVRARADRLRDALDLGRATTRSGWRNFALGGTFIGLTRDRGHGAGDRRRRRRGGARLCRHRRGGRPQPATRHRGPGPAPRGRRGATRSPCSRPARRAGAAATTSTTSSPLPHRIPLRAGGDQLFTRPPDGQLPDGRRPGDLGRRTRAASCTTRKGVWIGDGSAFPTSSGTNPMVSIMALARRTATAIAEDAGRQGRNQRQEAGGRSWQLRHPQHRRPGHPTEPIVRDKLFIGGEWVDPAGSETIEVIDSTTEEVIGTVPEGTDEDVDRAVEGRARRLRGLVAGAARGAPRRLLGDLGRARGARRGARRR